jgi:predicted secreted protein
VYNSDDYLHQQGRLSADVDRPFQRILEEIIAVARDYKQVSLISVQRYVIVRYPHTFGTGRKKLQNH